MAGSWCHFPQRLQLNQFQMETNHVAKGFEDQKYSYIVLRKGPRPLADPALPRIIRRPLKREGHVMIDVCASDSTFRRVVVARSHGKDVFKDARRARWGVLWPHPPVGESRAIPTLMVRRLARPSKEDEEE